MIWNIPNLVCLVRVILIVLALPIMYHFPEYWIASSSLIAVSFLLDAVDGYLARKLNQKTVFGSLLDVIADRITEYLLWVFFAYERIIPLWAPLIVIPRGVLTDSIRSIANAKGISVYDLPRSKVAKALVSNRVPRITIGLGKAVLFILSAIQLSGKNLEGVIFWLTVFVVIVNLARGLPVIIEGARVLES